MSSGRKPLLLLPLVLLLAAGAYLGYIVWSSWSHLRTILPITVSNSEEKPAMGERWEEKGRVNVLLLGLDRRPDEGRAPARTDTILILTVDPYEGTAGMLSIPRDLFVPIPISETRVDRDRINTAYVWGELLKYPGGGPALIRETIEYNFGIPIHYHVIVDFVGFERIINALGCVEVELAEPLYDPEFPTADYGVMTVSIPRGKQCLDGRQALWYARSRYQGGDFARMQRQQQLLLALREKVLRLNVIPKLPQLSRELAGAVETDMPLEAALNLARVVANLGVEQIQTRALTTQNGVLTPAVTNGGASVLLMDREKVRGIVQELFYDSRLRAEAATVEVLNGTTRPGLATRTAEYLRQQGIELVTVGNANGGPYRETTILLSNGKVYTAGKVAAILGLTPDRVRVQRDSSVTSDIQVILGVDAPDL